MGGRFVLAAFDYAFTLPIGGIANTTGSHRLAFSFRFGAEADLLHADELAAAAELKRAQDRAALQEEKIRVLQERLDAVVRQSLVPAAQSAAVSQPVQQPVSVPVQVQPAAQAQPDAAAQAEINRQLEAMKAELEKSRAEMEAIKARAAAKAAAPQPKSQQPSGPRSYVVKDGDTLESIAASMYGNSARWPEIYRANSGSLGRGGEVKPGQVLTLP